jgi:hypothetical protein
MGKIKDSTILTLENGTGKSTGKGLKPHTIHYYKTFPVGLMSVLTPINGFELEHSEFRL